jgi:hypothetical protein
MNNTESRQITAKFTGKCVRCGGEIPSGTRCEWERGVGVRHIACPVRIEGDNAVGFINALCNRHSDENRNRDKQVSVTMGVFKKDGRIYVVKPNKEKTRVYAKEIVESPARMTENGAIVDFEARYAPGIVFKLTEADRWDLADAKDFLTKFSRCIVCGRHLKAAKSVERSIGPVCAGYFKGSSHVNGSAHHDSAGPAQGPAAAAIEDEGQRGEADEMLANDAIKNAQINMTAAQRELLAELKRMNARSRAWVAEDPKNRWSGILTEDIAHWAQSGITSVADFDAMQAAEDEKERRKESYYIDDGAQGRP